MKDNNEKKLDAISNQLKDLANEFSKKLIDDEVKDAIAKMTKNSLEWEAKHPHELSAAMAAPQLGINRRIIIVRDDLDDKTNDHFTALINPEVIKTEGKTLKDYEGCLSVPPMRGLVPRYDHIRITYTHPGTLERVTETVEGYTAIIFQHEYDHLEGTLYIDRADTLFRHDAWAAERSAFNYAKPAWWPEK